MKKALIICTSTFMLLLFFESCSKSSGGGTGGGGTGGGGTGGGGGFTVNCSTVTNKAFAADVSPIVQSVCAVSGCHAAGSTNGPGSLTNYTEVFNARTRIRTAIQNGSMPQGTTLSNAQRGSIICWIDNGAPNN